MQFSRMWKCVSLCRYYTTNKLTQKTDVYGFGVVLLELLTSRRAFSEDIHTINWVRSMISEGSVENIIDLRLKGGYDINIAWKVTETALACVDHVSVKRPAMNGVAIELKNCLQAEKTRIGKPNNQSGEISLFLRRWKYEWSNPKTVKSWNCQALWHIFRPDCVCKFNLTNYSL